MVKHILFLRWWLMVAIIAVAGYFCNTFGIFQEILDKDMTFISVGVGAAFVIMSLWCGMKTFRLSRAIHKEELDVVAQMGHQEEVGWFAAETFTTLGFIGTIIGMIYALKGFIGINPSDITSLQGLISDLVYGMSTALYTTLVGLVCSRLLMLQYFNMSHARRKATSNETEI
jgi:flagellar motor component MotA